jgi:hypothetical protein
MTAELGLDLCFSECPSPSIRSPPQESISKATSKKSNNSSPIKLKKTISSPPVLTSGAVSYAGKTKKSVASSTSQAQKSSHSPSKAQS